MTEEVKKEVAVPVESAPSRRETEHFNELVVGGPTNLVMVSCMFDGKPRFAIAKAKLVKGKRVLHPLAIVLYEGEQLWLRSIGGELLPVEEADGSALLN